MSLDFSKDLTTHCSVTIRSSVVIAVDAIVKSEKQLQPKISHKISRSSVMSLLLSEQLEVAELVREYRNDGLKLNSFLEKLFKLLDPDNTLTNLELPWGAEDETRA